MQKQTFDQIKEIKDRILRLEKMLMAAGWCDYSSFNSKYDVSNLT